MLPGITERQAAYAREVGRGAGRAWPTWTSAQPVKDRADIEARVRELRGGRASTALLVVMLTYGPAMRVARALARHARCRSAWPTSSPSRRSRAAWDMGDLTYNQGIHGAQDTANAMVRAGRAVPRSITGRLARRRRSAAAVGEWARAAAAVTRWRALRVAVFGYAMNGMGDIRVDEHALLRTLGPQVDALAPGRAAPRGRGRRRRRGRAR